jgi:serine/threonine-protein phosphatase 2A regulatory subunit A
LELAKDPIPNIRFNVAKALEVMATSFIDVADGHVFIRDCILPTLERQKNDTDADVRYFAARALQKAISSEA